MPTMAARPCSGSRPKVNGSATMIVIVTVTPGSAPPITPTNVPIVSGSRYFHCATLASASPRSSYISEPRPAAARQQDVQVALEYEVRRGSGDRREQHDRDPAARGARRRERHGHRQEEGER